MRVHFHEAGLLEELRYRLQHPAALLIVLPNGLVKLINALPFVCGDLRTRVARRRSGPTSSAPGSDPRVAHFVDDLAVDPRQDARRCTNGSISDRDAAGREPARRARCGSGCCASSAWCATASFSTRDCFPTCSARRGPTRSPARFDAPIFWSGLAGVVLAVVGVEAFNEYFDSRMGTDRVFNPADLPPMSDAVFWLGVAAFAGALAVGVYLTVRGGWPILAFALLGGAAAIFYVAPPIRWAYRGLGEPVIALSYGPWMVLGSLYLHTQRRVVGRVLARRWCRAS